MASDRTGRDARGRGIVFALLSTVFFGTAPIFGKLAYRAQVSPFTLVALRTVFAAAALWLLYGLFWRPAIRTTWRNLMGCVGMGVANGVGSLLYYSGLTRIDASLAQLLYTLYPIWVFVFLIAAGHHVSANSLVRLALALAGVVALTYTGSQRVDILGVMLLLSSGACYAWHLVLGQWTLADVDSRTVTLYVLTTMSVVVIVARLASGAPWTPISPEGWMAVAGLTLLPTIMARLFVFAGLRSLGGVQSSLLGLAELVVALLIAYLLLGERMTALQWLGSALLIASVALGSRESDLEVTWEDLLRDGGWREIGSRSAPDQ
ncbi:MAG: DMT family transporter [Anaerolineae bacterium]|nr:DMT family transporter [Anaerolineae bacterium]